MDAVADGFDAFFARFLAAAFDMPVEGALEGGLPDIEGGGCLGGDYD